MAILPSVTSPYDAIKSLIGDSADVSYAAGLENIKSMDKSGFDDAVKVATNADQVVLILGLDSSIEREGQDRDDISLPGLQSDLAKLIVSANPKTVVVLINGGMVAIDELKEEKNVAIIEAFYPGFYGGEALAQTMFGLSNRWGKLPATIYDKTYTTRYNMLDFGMAPHGDQPGRTYRYGGGTDGVLYPFGYGLSYTNFDLGFENSSTEHKNGEALLLQDDTTIKFQVENVGKREGDTVVMAFFTPEEFSIANPTNELASALKYELFSFQRVSLNAGELDHLAIDVNPSTLMVYDENGDGVSIPGKYTITITEGGINDENALKRTVIVPGTKKDITTFFEKCKEIKMCITYCNLYERIYINIKILMVYEYYKFKYTNVHMYFRSHGESVFAFLYYFTKFIYNFYITRIQHFFLFKYKIKHIKY